MTVEEILRALVAIPTPSAASNLALIDWVVHFLEERGWYCVPYPYMDEMGIAKANLIARPEERGEAAPIDLAFICHTDTVPYAASWTDALQLTVNEENHTLRGSGACDTKGALACLLAAVSDVRAESVKRDFALILTADEEVGCKGMERLLNAAKLRIRAAIVSEPTQLYPGVTGKGYGLARVLIEGAEAHSAFPAKGVSAIVTAARFMREIELTAGAPKEQNELFNPPVTTWNVGTIEGGTAKNIIPGRCSFLVEWRPVPEENPRKFLEMLRGVAARLVKAEPRLRIDVEGLRADYGFVPAGLGELQATLRKYVATCHSPIGISFGSEATRVASVAEEVIVIGPGDMQTAHSERECVPENELRAWTSVLRRMLKVE